MTVAPSIWFVRPSGLTIAPHSNAVTMRRISSRRSSPTRTATQVATRAPFSTPPAMPIPKPGSRDRRAQSTRSAATANHFARESHMDELADALGIDPLVLRLRHLRDERLAAVFHVAADRIDWARRSREPGFGMGIAGGVEKGARVAT